MAELVSSDDAWPSLAAEIRDSNGSCVSLIPDDTRGDCLHALQVMTRSVLGAMAFHTGGLLIDHGWIRLFGAGHGPLPSLAVANSLPAAESPLLMLIGVDVLGGRFAIN